MCLKEASSEGAQKACNPAPQNAPLDLPVAVLKIGFDATQQLRSALNIDCRSPTVYTAPEQFAHSNKAAAEAQASDLNKRFTGMLDQYQFAAARNGAKEAGKKAA